MFWWSSRTRRFNFWVNSNENENVCIHGVCIYAVCAYTYVYMLTRSSYKSYSVVQRGSRIRTTCVWILANIHKQSQTHIPQTRTSYNLKKNRLKKTHNWSEYVWTSELSRTDWIWLWQCVCRHMIFAPRFTLRIRKWVHSLVALSKFFILNLMQHDGAGHIIIGTRFAHLLLDLYRFRFCVVADTTFAWPFQSQCQWLVGWLVGKHGRYDQNDSPSTC